MTALVLLGLMVAGTIWLILCFTWTLAKIMIWAACFIIFIPALMLFMILIGFWMPI